MPIQHAIWKVADKPEPHTAGRLPSEQKLEEMIVGDPRILSSEPAGRISGHPFRLPV